MTNAINTPARNKTSTSVERAMKVDAINALIRDALTAAHAYGVHVEAIRAAVKSKAANVARATLMQGIAKFYGVALKEKAKGHGLTWDKDSEKWGTAKKAYERMLADVFGPAPKAAKPEIEISPKLAKLAALFVAMADADAAEQGLKGSSRLVATALAQARNA